MLAIKVTIPEMTKTVVATHSFSCVGTGEVIAANNAQATPAIQRSIAKAKSFPVSFIPLYPRARILPQMCLALIKGLRNKILDHNSRDY